MMENIDKYYKDRLEEYTENPAADTWDKIANQLGHDRKHKGIVLAWRIAAGVALLVSLSVLVHNTQKQTVAELAEKPVLQHISIPESPGHDNNYNQNKIIKDEKPIFHDSDNQRLSAHKPKVEKVIVRTVEKDTQHFDLIEDNNHSNISKVESSKSNYFREQEHINMLQPIKSISPDIIAPTIAQNFLPLKISENKPSPGYSMDQLLALNQEEPMEKERKNNWLIGGQFAPQYTYRNIVSEKYPSYVVDQINSKESPVITYAGGINVTVSPNKRLSIQSGIYYSKIGQEQNELIQLSMNMYNNGSDISLADDKYKEEVDNPALVYIGNSTGNININGVTVMQVNRSPIANLPMYNQSQLTESNTISAIKPINSVTQYFEYLEVPVNLKYKVIDRKFDVSFIGGLSTNFLVATAVNLKYFDNSNTIIGNTTNDLNKINYAGTVGFGFEYPLIKNFLITVEPKFKYYLNSIDKESFGNIHPYLVGIYTGVSYVF